MVHGVTPSRLFWVVFWATIVILALLYVYAQLHVARMASDQQGRVMVSEAFFADWNQALPEVFAGMKLEFDTAGVEIEQRVSQHIDAAFVPVYEQIPAFLNFHYSVIGEYTELATALSGDLGGELQRILFTEIGFEQRLDDAMSAIHADGEAVFGALMERVKQQLQQRFELDEVELGLLSSVVTLSSEDALKRFGGSELLIKGAGAVVGAGAVAAVVAKTLGKKLSAKLAAKVAGKTTVKAAGFGAGAATGATSGLLCGPAAWICAPVAAVAVGAAFWLLTDKAVVEMDEYLNRDAFEVELRQVIDVEKQRIKITLVGVWQQHLQTILEDNKIRLEGITTRELIESAR